MTNTTTKKPARKAKTTSPAKRKPAAKPVGASNGKHDPGQDAKVLAMRKKGEPIRKIAEAFSFPSSAQVYAAIARAVVER